PLAARTRPALVPSSVFVEGAGHVAAGIVAEAGIKAARDGARALIAAGIVADRRIRRRRGVEMRSGAVAKEGVLAAVQGRQRRLGAEDHIAVAGAGCVERRDRDIGGDDAERARDL